MVGSMWISGKGSKWGGLVVGIGDEGALNTLYWSSLKPGTSTVKRGKCLTESQND